LALRDGRRFDGPPSLSGHCGHEAIFGAQRSVANDPTKSPSAAALRRIVACSTAMHRDLVSYAEVSERQTSEKIKAKEW